MNLKKAVLSNLLVLCSATVCLAQQQMPPAHVEAIYFFGHGDRDVAKLKEGLPIKVGVKFASPIQLLETRPKVEEAVQKAAGLPVTDVSFVSPGGEKWLVYIGVAGPSVKTFKYNPAPAGSVRLPDEAMRIYREANQAFMKAMMAGHAGEDDSRGFALSADDAELRAKQLAMRDYAVKSEAVIRNALKNSSDPDHRRAAAQLLGYANRSLQQIHELVRASRDADETVRNNATRALIVLAKSDAKTAAMIPAGGFVEMLNSGQWTDRNKASGLLAELTRSRSAQLFKTLRSLGFESLAEMARWESGHAQAAREILGRIAGIDEKTLSDMVTNDVRAGEIVAAAKRATP